MKYFTFVSETSELLAEINIGLSPQTPAISPLFMRHLFFLRLIIALMLETVTGANSQLGI
jgi:hypothetical protein